MDKYNSAKYRLVVRKTNRKIICQIITATLNGDKVMCAAESAELKKFGLKAGLTNYPSCITIPQYIAYLTGLLLARRLLKKLQMDQMYPGKDKVDGEKFDVADEPNDDRKPFQAVLDSGLTRTTTGNRIFGALKGVLDGGIHIPHSMKRFPGYTESKDGKENKGENYDPAVHRDKIFGKNIDAYYTRLQKENPEKFKKQFSQWTKTLAENNVTTVQALYQKIHKQVRENSDRVKAERNTKPNRNFAPKQKKIGRPKRRENVQKKFAIARAQQKQ